jgi:hypothetical protein
MAYTPNPAPGNEGLVEYLSAELRRISEELGQLAEGRGFPSLHAEPLKPRDGMIVLADGTDWNPGSGAGFYERKGGVWSKL